LNEIEGLRLIDLVRAAYPDFNRMTKNTNRSGLSLAFAVVSLVLLCLAPAAAAGDLPDRTLTPGAVLTSDVGTICRPGYAKSVRHVRGKDKHAVYREYGIARHRPGEYEVDHLISLELGGSNDIRNLWPESYQTKPWNAHVKDKIENRLHLLVCAGRLDIREAQRGIATDWIAAYKRFLK
jgi:hypothetical protein